MMMEDEEMQKLKKSGDSSGSDSSSDSDSSNSDEAGGVESGDGDASSDDDFELDANPDETIENLEVDLKRTPYLYDKHVQLIKTYRKLYRLDKLNEARERMHIYYPLAPNLWLSWLKDAQQKMQTKEDREKVEALFKRACQDYQSVDVWLEYCTFAVGSLEHFNEKWVRSVFEDALSHVGGHISKGGQVWAAYRDFEMIRLAQIPRETNTTKQEAVDEQCEVIAKLFRRELSLPLRGMEEVFEEYKDWVTSVPADVKSSFERAKNYLSEVETLVDAIEDAESDEERYRAHVDFIDFTERKGVPSRIICAYEEALTAMCLRTELWQRYLNYLTKYFLTSSCILPQCRRAVRNCPWSLELWLLELECMERFQKDHEEIKKGYEEALQAGFTESVQFLSLWTAYTAYLRRGIDWNVAVDDLKTSKLVEELRDTFERAVIQLEKFFKNFGDPQCTLFRFWAVIEAKYLKNLPRARELWSEVMKRNHGNEAHMWLEYIAFERAYGDAKHCRKVLSRAINSVTDWPEHVFEACLRFEREEGTFETYIDVRNKIDQQRARLADRAAAAEAKQKATTKPVAQPEKVARRGQKRSADSKPAEDADKSFAPAPQPPKRKKPEPAPRQHTSPDTETSRTDSEGFVVPNAPGPSASPKIAPPPGYLAHKARQAMTTAAATEKPAEEVVPQSTDPREEMDDARTARTVFVSNIDFNAKESEIEEVFKAVGELSEIRLVKDTRGRSKGYAYVEFKTSEPVKDAMKLDRTAFGSRPMFVSECNPNKRFSFQYASGLEKNKLFVRNLPKTITDHALRTMFGEYGTITDVRIATYRNGSPKGHAYVDFSTDDAASRALVGTDNRMVGENNISVALSNPPKRREPMLGQPMEMEPSLGSGKRLTADSGKARTKISLVPRALAKKTLDPSSRKNPDKDSSAGSSATPSLKSGEQTSSSANGAPGNPQAITKSAGLSNEEFRKLFMKK